MTWVPQDDVPKALSRLTQSVNAAFRGRAGSRPLPTFVGNADFLLATNALTVTLLDSSTVLGGTIVAWLWNFGDGGTSTSQNPTHTYAAEGSYLVSLTITASNGTMAESSTTVEVEAVLDDGDDPVADFTTSINGKTVTYTDTSTDADGTVESRLWDFGDGLPTADFSVIVTNLSAAFTDTSTDVSPGTIVSRSWNFGDGHTSTATNPTNVYAAAGGYNVTLTVTDNDNHQVTSSQIVNVTTGATLGIPFGPQGFWSGSSALAAFGVFTLGSGSDQPSSIVAKISTATAASQKLRLTLTSGSHSNYTVPDPDTSPTASNPTPTKFDLGPNWASSRSLAGSKWANRMDLYNTPAIKSAVATGFANTTILGLDVLDEPQHISWGKLLTKEVLDAMATYAKAIFPTATVGCTVKWDHRPTERYHVLDFIITQYVVSHGNVNTWRDNALTQAALDGVAVVFSINVLNGGAGFGETSCPTPATGGTGYSAGRCKMSATQVETFGITLGRAGSGLLMWQYDTTFFGVAGNITAFANIAADLATKPRKSWRRTS
jgi:PKD repeat protein